MLKYSPYHCTNLMALIIKNVTPIIINKYASSFTKSVT